MHLFTTPLCLSKQGLRFVLSALLIGGAFYSDAQTDSVYTEADEMPYFEGCSDFENDKAAKRECSNYSLVAFIANNLSYPPDARANEIAGTVIVQFVVNKQGKVVQPQIIKDIGAGCGEAALAVLHQMPPWEAGIIDNQTVNVQLRLPINFNLTSGAPAQNQGHSIDWGVLRGQQVQREDLRNSVYQEVIVRDPLGNAMPISQLKISYERKRKYLFANSRGNITPKMRKIIKKAKKGGVLTLEAVVHQGGSFVEVVRRFRIE